MCTWDTAVYVLRVWAMAESQVPPQQQQDEKELMWLFLNSVGRQAKKDMELSPEESTNLLR